ARRVVLDESVETLVRLCRFLAFHGLDAVGGPAVRSDQEAAPTWARQRVLEIFRSRSQALDGANRINRVDLLSEFLDPTEVARCRNIPRRHSQDNFRPRRKTVLDLFRLAELGITG